MTTIAVNKPIVLASEASAWNDVTIVTAVNPDTTAGPNAGNFVINDASSLAAANAGNVIWSCPFATLFKLVGTGPIVGSGATTEGLVVSAMPGGVSVNLRFGE